MRDQLDLSSEKELTKELKSKLEWYNKGAFQIVAFVRSVPMERLSSVQFISTYKTFRRNDW